MSTNVSYVLSSGLLFAIVLSLQMFISGLSAFWVFLGYVTGGQTGLLAAAGYLLLSNSDRPPFD